jgi:hypothetical protein
VAKRSLPLPFVVLLQPLFPADTNVFPEQSSRFLYVLAHDGSENSTVIAMNLRQLRHVMSLAPNAENSQQDSRVRDRLQDPGVRCRTHKPGVKLQVRPDEPPHSFGVQLVLSGFFEPVAQHQDFLYQTFQGFQFFRAQFVTGRLTDGVDFEGFAQFLEFGYVSPRKVHHDAPARGSLLKKTLSPQAADRLP